MSEVISDPSVVINNEPFPVVPNSVTFTEGKGEQNMRASTTGGGTVEQVYSDNAESKFSMVKMAAYNTPDAVDLLRQYKTNRNNNVVVLTGKTSDGKKIRRTFNRAAILPDYEVPLGADTTIEIEFKSSPAV